jgi:hypothetical protein
MGVDCMKHARMTKVFTVLLGCALLGGVVGANASGAATKGKFTTTGTATGTIDDNGALSVTVDATSATVDSSTTVTGQLPPGSGIGKKTAKATTTYTATGTFSDTSISTKMPGTVSGTLTTTDGGVYTTPSILDFSISCTVSYPPLSIRCTVTLKGTASD